MAAASGSVRLILRVESRWCGPEGGRCGSRRHVSRRSHRVLAEVDHVLEEAAKDLEPEALPDAGEAGGIGQRLVEAVTEVPADTEAVHGQGEELPLRAQALEEHHQVELEEDHRIDGRPSSIGIGVLDPIPDEGQIEAGVEVAVEMVAGNEGVERNDDGWTELAGFGRTEHGGRLRRHKMRSQDRSERPSVAAVARRRLGSGL